MPFTPWPADPLALATLILILVGVPVVLRMHVSKAYGFGLLIIIVFGLQLFAESFLPRDPILRGLGLTPSAFLAGGQWWSPLTMMFVHAGFLHLFGNLFILLTAGPALEDRLGERAFVIVYFAAGFMSAFAGIALSVFAPDIVHPNVVMVGASGAIFGVLTTVAILYPRLNLPIILGILVFWLPAFAVLLVYLGFNVVYMFTTTNIAWYGHFAGFLVGLAIATRLPRKDAPGQLGKIDLTKLEALAEGRESVDILERLRAIGGETADDAAFRDAWLDRFFKHAKCPRCGGAFERTGLAARCVSGDYEFDLRKQDA